MKRMIKMRSVMKTKMMIKDGKKDNNEDDDDDDAGGGGWEAPGPESF